MTSHPYRITVMGAGAVGKMVGAGLAQSGQSVTLLVRRQEQASALLEKGIHAIALDGSRTVVPVFATDDASQLTSDLVILTVKSFDTRTAAKQIAGMKGCPAVLSLQNGLGNGEQLAAVLPMERIWLGIGTYGATSLSDYEVAIRGEGEWIIGASGDNGRAAEQVGAIFANAGWKIRLSTEIQQEVWKKALVNIGINPLTAIHRVTNGEIATRQELREQAGAAVEEAGQIAVRLGVLSPVDVKQSIDRMLEVCRLTAGNLSSMLQDIERGGRTEIDSLNGMIVRYGESLGADTPINRELTWQIRQLEAGRA